jgi:hypothetical protein
VRARDHGELSVIDVSVAVVELSPTAEPLADASLGASERPGEDRDLLTGLYRMDRGDVCDDDSDG